METTGSLKSQHTTAFVELSSAVHSKVSEIGVTDAPTDRGCLCFLNPPNDLPLEKIIPAMRRLFMDSGVASSRPGVDGKGVAVVTGGESVPTSQGRNTGTPSSGVHDNKQGDPWVPDTNQGPVGFCGKGDVVIHRPRPVASNRETEARAEHVRSARCCGSARRGVATRPSGPHQQGTPPLECQGGRDL